MSAWNNETGTWEGDTAQANTGSTGSTGSNDRGTEHLFPDKSFPLQAPSAIPQPEPTIEDHAMTIRERFDKIMSKAVEATELAARVTELETQVRALTSELANVRNDLTLERETHRQTREGLGNVQSALSQRESTIHDLVIERDIVIEERNSAQRERDDARVAVKNYKETHERVTGQLHGQMHENDVLRERNEMLNARITALRSAFGALNDL